MNSGITTMLPHIDPSPKRGRQQQQLLLTVLADDGRSKRQRFWPCPVCNRCFPHFRLDEHVNQCLDAAQSPAQSTSASSPTRLLLPEYAPLFNVTGPALSNTQAAVSPGLADQGPTFVESPLPVLVRSNPVLSPQRASTLSGAESNEVIVESNCCRVPPSAKSPSNFDEIIAARGVSIKGRCEEGLAAREMCFYANNDKSGTLDCSAGTGREISSFEEGEAQLNIELRFLGNAEKDGGQEKERTDVSKEREMIEEIRDGAGRALDKPPAGFKLFQRQHQSQARLSMMHKFSSSVVLERKPAVTVLQPGMVVFRNWLSLETQQKLVEASHNVAHLFHRPTTSGGGKYHVYSMCWGPTWDTKARRYTPRSPEKLLPEWMFELSQELAGDAQLHSSVHPPQTSFDPDVGLVNFYPAKAEELGVVGLGGHQDLDGTSLMPVVSVSVGDSMTFFYRRLPPFSRRKSGVSISVDEKAARSCKDGDAAHNRERQILLESGDVLVFGGESRLVYHGTRHVQPGTRPPGLHMVPGRLNFTFRQSDFKAT